MAFGPLLLISIQCAPCVGFKISEFFRNRLTVPLVAVELSYGAEFPAARTGRRHPDPATWRRVTVAKGSAT